MNSTRRIAIGFLVLILGLVLLVQIHYLLAVSVLLVVLGVCLIFYKE